MQVIIVGINGQYLMAFLKVLQFTCSLHSMHELIPFFLTHLKIGQSLTGSFSSVHHFLPSTTHSLQLRPHALSRILFLTPFIFNKYLNPNYLNHTYMSIRKRGNLGRELLVFFTLFSIAILLRSSTRNICLYGDEFAYAVWGKLIILNNWDYPKVCAETHPPLLPYTIAAFIKMFGSDFGILKIIPVIYGSLTVCVVYLLGSALFDRRVGVLSAIFLCFCSYHILYSQVTMMEIPSLFFIFSFLYLFWKGYFEHENAKYLYLAGIALGLGILVKFTMFLPLAAAIVFVLWYKRSIKALLDRKILVILSIAFLIILPYLLLLYIKGVNPFYFHLVTKLEIGAPHGWQDAPILDLVGKGFIEYIRLLTYGGYLIPWPTVLRITAVLLFPITVLPHIYLSLRGNMNSSYMLIYFIVSIISIALFFGRHLNFLLYLFPPYFILLSAITFRCVDRLKCHFSDIKSLYLNIAKSFILVLVFVFIFSYMVMGAFSPFIEKGESDGIRLSAFVIKDRLISEEFSNSTALVGIVVYGPHVWFSTGAYILEYYFDEYDVRAKVVPLLTHEEPTDAKSKFVIDMESIKRDKPRFLVIDENIYIDGYVTCMDKIEISKDYHLLSSSRVETINPNVWNFYVF